MRYQKHAPMRRGRRRPVTGTVAAGVLLAAACQSFTPVPGATPAPGEEVRVVLVDAASRRLAPTLGADVASVDGRVIDGSDDSLRISVRATTLHTGQNLAWRDERVAVARGDVATLQQRRPATGRTVALGALVVAGAMLAARAVGAGSGSGFVAGGTTTGR